MNISKKWGSHLPVLIKTMSLTNGDVLEMGMGFYSTPYLHWVCDMQKRKLVSYESIEKYFRLFRQYKSESHEITFIKDWDSAAIEKPWDVVLIDHDPAIRRIIDIKRLANLAKYIVVHDTQPEEDWSYKYSEIYPLFKYRYNYTKVISHTSVLSNFIDVSNLEI